MVSSADQEAVNRGQRALSWVLAAQLVAVIVTGALILEPELRHWAIVPLIVCGIASGVDVIDWLRRRLDLFDPQAVIGLFAFHLCFLAPLLHFLLDHWPAYVAPAADWQEAIGLLSLVNAGGLLLYRLVVAPPDRVAPVPAEAFDERRFFSRAVLVGSVGLIAFAMVVMMFGGPSGYVATMTEGRESLAGFGGLLIVAESFPLVFFAAIVVRYRVQLRGRPMLVIGLVVLFIVAQFVAGGLRGSRSNTVWPTLIAIGMVHLVVNPIHRRTLIAWALILVGFMYLYGFYKTAGVDALDLLARGTSIERLSDQTGRTIPLLLLEDFSRSGIQAIVLDRLRSQDEVTLGSGVTYVGDASIVVPRTILPDRPPDKVAIGTDILYGPGTFESGFRSSHIYGLVGEAAINFGAWPAVLSFGLLGIYIRWARRFYRRALTGSLTAGIIGPALSVSAVLVLGSDLDNLIWFMAKHVLPLAVVLYAGTLFRRSGSGQPASGLYPKTPIAQA